jgi:hypothetical protein
MEELPEKDKALHAEVKYERPSAIPAHYCGNCKSVIEATSGNRCKTVVEPIYLNGWCERWPGKK